MKKGDIIYFNPKAREKNQKLVDKKHPIVCLEDISSSNDTFHSIILSSGRAPKKSPVKNIKLNLKHFDFKECYTIPGNYKHEYLVSMGIWKEVPQMPQKEDGHLSIKGLNEVLCELLKHTSENKQEELYTTLIQLVKKYVDFEYVTTDIKTHIENNHLNN